MILRRLSALAALLLAACGHMGNDGRNYPSLARRPAESGVRPAQPAPPPVPATAAIDPQDTAQADSWAEQARKGAAAFDALFPVISAQVRAASGAPVSSEAWVAAHVALARLERARGDSVMALAGLDSRYAERARAASENAVTPAADDPLGMARREALAAVDSQNDRIDALKAMLSQP